MHTLSSPLTEAGCRYATSARQRSAAVRGCCAAPAPSRYLRAVCRAAASSDSSPQQTVLEPPIIARHVLLAVIDQKWSLSEGTKQALSMAALLTRKDKAKLTVLVVEEPGKTTNEPGKLVDTLAWHLQEQGCPQYEVVQHATEKPASVLISDMADEVEADMVVVSSEAVHSKLLDANQLAEFLSMPLLMLS